VGWEVIECPEETAASDLGSTPEVEGIRFPWRSWWLDTTLRVKRDATQKETTFPAAALGEL